MCRAKIHTSFVIDNVLRLGREELDGAAGNERYPKDFFIDLIFTDARNQSNLLMSGTGIQNNSDNRKSVISKFAPEESKEEGVPNLKLVNVEEEEKLLMSGAKNVENKDDFWITLSQQLQDRHDDEETRKRKKDHVEKQKAKVLQVQIIDETPGKNPYVIDSIQSPLDYIKSISNRTSDLSNDRNSLNQIIYGSPTSSSSSTTKDEQRNPFGTSVATDAVHDESDEHSVASISQKTELNE